MLHLFFSPACPAQSFVYFVPRYFHLNANLVCQTHLWLQHVSSCIQACGKGSWSDTEKSPSIRWRGYSDEVRVTCARLQYISTADDTYTVKGTVQICFTFNLFSYQNLIWAKCCFSGSVLGEEIKMLLIIWMLVNTTEAFWVKPELWILSLSLRTHHCSILVYMWYCSKSKKKHQYVNLFIHQDEKQYSWLRF